MMTKKPSEETEVFRKIITVLEENHINYKLLEHEPVYTSEQAARIRNTDVSMGAKAIICFADKKPILIVVPGDRKIDFKKFKLTFKIKDLRMATPEEVFAQTGLEVGSIPPVGKCMSLNSYYDGSFEKKRKVTFNAGSHTRSVIMEATDLLKLERPVIADLT